jgi:hypothetical protein
MFKYAMLYRPASFGALPRDMTWQYAEAPHDIAYRLPHLPRSNHRHGVIETSRKLTAEEIETYQMLEV